MIQQPNFFGNLEEVDELTDWAHANSLLVIAVVNPTSLAIFKPPGEWGSEQSGNRGADIVCGEGQPLGVPLASGGPYFGFMATRLAHIRQMPGRIVGRTVDTEGQAGFHADAAGAGAAHPPQQGDLQHLHQSGTAGDGRDDLYLAPGTRGTRARRGRVRGAHGVPGAGADADSRRHRRLRNARAFTRRCCFSTARSRRCWPRSPSAASPADSISRRAIPNWGTRCWFAPPRPSWIQDIDAYARAMKDAMQCRAASAAPLEETS